MVNSSTWKISNILSESVNERFEIPRYQRGYAWKSTNVEHFWQDLIDISETPEKIHSYGTIYCEDKSVPGTVYIVDGQQRITTAMIFLAVCRDRIDELVSNSQEANNMHSWLFRYDTAKRTVDDSQPRVKLGKTNDEYFKLNILKRMEWKKKAAKLKSANNASEQSVQRAYTLLRKLVTEETSDMEEDASIKWLNDLASTLRYNFEVVSIDVPTQMEAYRMFSTINSRGLKIAEDDMIKQVLFAKYEDDLKKAGKDKTDVDDLLEEINDRWTEAYDKITGKKDADYNLTNFIHHYLIVNENALSLKKNNVYEYVEKMITDGKKDESGVPQVKDPKQMLDDIIDAAAEFTFLRDPEIQFVGRQKIIKLLISIRETKKIALYPSVIAGYNKYYTNGDTDSFEKLLHVLFKFHVRNKTICGVGATPLDDCLRKVTKKIMDGDNPPALADIIQIMKLDDVHQNDRILVEKLQEFDCGEAIAAFLLEEIEKDENPDKKIGDDVSVEHIMPGSRTKWEKYIKEKNNLEDDDDVKRFHTKYHKYLGNQTLLNIPDNSKNNNNPYTDKLIQYGSSGYEITKRIKDKYVEWNEESILNNQKYYAEKLEKILAL